MLQSHPLNIDYSLLLLSSGDRLRDPPAVVDEFNHRIVDCDDTP